MSRFFNDFDSFPQDNNSQSHIWSDYLELLCVVDPRQEVSVDDMVKRLVGNEDLGDTESLSSEFDENLDSWDSLYSNQGQKRDNQSRSVRDWFSVLQYRQDVFGSFYPFKLSPDAQTISLAKRNNTFDDAQKLYLTLLIASNLAYVQQNYRQKLTDSFELICVEALRNMLSTEHVYPFSSKLGNKSRYTGNTQAKFERLAKDIGEMPSPDLSEISSRSTGDGGVDIVAWFDTGDTESSRVVLFGQCACSQKSWSKKRSEIHPDFLRPKIIFRHYPMGILLIPHAFRQSNGLWQNVQDVNAVAIMDRQRILHFLRTEGNLFIDLPASEIVKEFISHRETLF
jgi:hypothetical protein